MLLTFLDKFSYLSYSDSIGVVGCSICYSSSILSDCLPVKSSSNVKKWLSSRLSYYSSALENFQTLISGFIPRSPFTMYVAWFEQSLSVYSGPASKVMIAQINHAIFPKGVSLFGLSTLLKKLNSYCKSYLA